MSAPVDRSEAYVAAAQALAAAAVRQLLALEGDDPDIGAVVVECSGPAGSVEVTLCNSDGVPVGGYTL